MLGYQELFMRTVTLKINYAVLKEQIEEDYFKTLDLFYKAFIVSLCLYDRNVKPVVFNSFIENGNYHRFMTEVCDARDRGEDIINLIDPVNNAHIFLDMSVYTEEFFTKRHNDKKANIYSLTIDDHYNAVITNKQVGKNVY